MTCKFLSRGGGGCRRNGTRIKLPPRSQVITTGGYVRPLIEVNSHSTALYWNSFKWRINSINWMGCWVLDRENVRIISGRANVFYICRFITRESGAVEINLGHIRDCVCLLLLLIIIIKAEIEQQRRPAMNLIMNPVL